MPELLVTMLIAAVMVSLAVPGVTTVIKDNRAATQVNEFITAIHLARSEAIKRGQRVTLCKSSSGTACTLSDGWEKGWIVFADADADAVFDPGEELIRVHGELSGSTTLNGSGNVADYISYVATGLSTLTSGASQSGVVVWCDDRGFGDDARAISLSPTGRARAVEASASGASGC